MITNPADYQQLLYQLEDENFPIKYPSLPSPEDEALIEINLQTKKIENTNNYVTIEGDHAAETLYFEVNRYHGLVDLSNMMCIVSYINADNEKRIYPVPYYDLVTKKDKIIFPWILNYSATKKTGLLKYMITFYHIEKNTNNLMFNLNTQPDVIKVYNRLDYDNILQEEDYYVVDDDQVVQQIWERLSRLEGYVGSDGGLDVYWLVL